MRIAIFGAGGIAYNAFFPLLTVWQGVEIIGVFSRTQKSVDIACSKFGLQNGTTSALDLVGMKPDAAFVLTNDQTHFGYTKLLLKAGIDVFVEKPLAQNSKEVQNLAEIAEEENRILMVGFNRRFSTYYQQAKEIMKGKKIQLAIIQKNRSKASHVNLYNNYLDDTIHQIDLLRFYCGDAFPLDTSFELRDGKLIGAVSICSLTEGGLGLVVTSLQAGSWQENVKLHGENLSVEVDAFEKLTVHSSKKDLISGTDRIGKWVPDLKNRGFYGEIEHFLNCVESRHQPVTNGFEALQTHLLLEKMVEMGNLHPFEHPLNGWDEISRWE